MGVKQTAEHIWLVSFMEYDPGYFDDETCRLEPIEDPSGPETVTHVSGMICDLCPRKDPG